MAAIGIVYTLLTAFELWCGRGDEVWRWPIMVLLLAHAAAIPIHIPLAGAWTHPDPSDLDLLTFAIFEGAFVYSGPRQGSDCRTLSARFLD